MSGDSFVENNGDNSNSGEVAPAFLENDESDYANQRKPPKRLKKGWMLLEVISRETKVAGTGTYGLKLFMSPVDENGELVKGGRAPLDIWLPKANKGKKLPDGTWSGFIDPKTGKQHVAPNTTYGCYMACIAFDPGFPRPPRKLRVGVYEGADGATLTQTEATAAFKASDKLVLDTVTAWYNDQTALLGKRIYGFVDEEVHQQDKDKPREEQRIYSKVTKTRATAPDDEPVITADFFIGGEE